MVIDDVPARKQALYKIGFRRGLRTALDNEAVPKPYNSPWFAKGVADGVYEMQQRKMHKLLTGEPIGVYDFRPRHIE